MGWPGPMTDRQLAAWHRWLADDWNRPSRTDHYLMQVAAEVRRVPCMFGGDPNKVQVMDLKLPFGNVQPAKPREFDRESAMAAARARQDELAAWLKGSAGRRGG